MDKYSNFKIIFSDVDGTLLDKNRELSPTTIRHIHGVVKNHSLFFIMVSARMPAGMQHLYDQIGFKFPIICYNGALILNHLKAGFNLGNALYSTSIDVDTTNSLFQMADEMNLHFSLFSNNDWLSNKRDIWTKREEENTKVLATVNPDIPKTINQIAKSNSPIHKIMIMGEASKIELFYNKASQLFNKISIYRSKDTYLEISPMVANKATGCSILMKHLSFSPENAIAFGDNFNDIEMLKLVNLGIAMGNAPEIVKSNANLIAPPNFSDGIAVTLDKIFS